MDGERTRGLELVERLLTTGERYEGDLPPDVAAAALEALEHLELPWLVDEMVESGEMLAAQIHSQASRGLQEAVQNAQDQGARQIRFGFRKRAGGSELLIAHDGDPVAIHDVVSMAYPLLSGSRADPEKIGRFGVGLKTLNQLGDSLEVHCPPIPGFEIRGARIHRTTSARRLSGFWDPSARQTLFVLRLRDEAFDLRFFKRWLQAWDSSSLVFLSHLHDVRLIDLGKRKTVVLHRLETKRRDTVSLDLKGEREAQRVVFRDGASARSWTRYSVRYPIPKSLRATHKALGQTVRLSIAIPHRNERTRLHVGLPLEEPCDLPFSLSAPFDPNVDRTHIRDHNSLNEWLFDRIGDLAAAVSIQRFTERPSTGWRSIPLGGEQAGAPGSWLRERSEVVVGRVRNRVAKKLRLDLPDGSTATIDGLVYEVAALDGLFDENDVERLHRETKYQWEPARRAVPKKARDSGRWREVLHDLPKTEALSLTEAFAALKWPDDEVRARGVSWLIRLAHSARGNDLLLSRAAWIVIDDTGERVSPNEIAERGTLLVHAVHPDTLATELGVAQAIAPEYRARTPEATALRHWLAERGALRERPTEGDALRALARGSGDEPVDLRTRDQLVVRIRSTLDQIPADDRDRVASGVGRNVLLDGYEFRKGERSVIAIRPAEAYLPSAIDKNEGWPTAAGHTPGIRWIHRRYAEVLKTGREARGHGALAFLRALGAATAPRLIAAPAPSSDPHASLALDRLPAQQRTELKEYAQASGLGDDWLSPDLDAVLTDLIRERRAGERRRRGRALFLSLDRAWADRREQYGPRSTARAVRHYYSWQYFGDVSATWVARLASEPWMSTRERAFRSKPPRELTVLTSAAYEVEGENPGAYAYEVDADHVDSPVVEALGMQGRPWASTIIERLEQLREEERAGATIHQPWVDRCHRALASYCEGGDYADRSNLSKRQIQTSFGSANAKEGLIRWNGAWLSPSKVRRGPFLSDVIPWVGDDHALWRTLGIRETDLLDCVDVFRHLSEASVSDPATELRAFRRTLSLLASERRVKDKLRDMPLRTYRGWQRRSGGRVFAVGNPVVAEALGTHWPVWSITLPFDELAPLAEVLGIEVLGEGAFEPNVASSSMAPDDVQAELPSAVTHLRDYLLLHHADVHAGVPAERWENLAHARVVLGSDWAVRVRARGRRPLDLSVRAYLFPEQGLFCAIDEEEAAAHDAGGQAIASYILASGMGSEARSVVSLSWEIAFRRRREAPAAIDLDVEGIDEDDGVAEGPLLRGLKSRRRSIGRRKGGRPAKTEQRDPRELVSLDELDLRSVSAGFFDGKRRGTLRISRSTTLKPPESPRRNGGRTSSPAARAHRGYTDAEREETAFRIMEALLEDSHGLILDDVRSQGGVGADAVDREKDIWVELKAHGRDPADVVNLEPSEAKRAEEKRDKYWLVIAWNLEKPKVPAFVVIPDPLRRLDTYLGRGLKLTGFHDLLAAPRTETAMPAGHGRANR